MKFDMSNNGLYSAGAKALAGALKGNTVMTELNIATNSMGKTSNSGDADMSGVSAIADAIPTMGAMTTLNIASNYLYDAGADALAGALKAPNCALTSVDASDNELTDKGKKALQQAAGSR